MIESITSGKLKELRANHKNNKDFRIMTDAVFVTRAHLEQFLNTMAQDHPLHDAYKICFIRYESSPADSRILSAGNNLTQLSLIFIPTMDTNTSTWDSTDVTDESDKIPTLSFCVPGKPDGDSTGHCPPNKPCQ